MKYAVYLIKSEKDNGFYTGISDNLRRRIKEHNSGKLKITSFRKPFELVWYKFYDNAVEARNHEKWLKKKSKEYKNKLAEIGVNDMLE